MALLEVVESSQSRVHDLRHELDKAREALDRTDAVLATADEGLVRAESAIVTTKKWTPVGLAVIGAVLVVGVAAVILIRRRRHRSEDFLDD
jgi:ElaB/YqjD/DUF883 family membrane-anchored ribosome-binding protein